MKLFTMISKGLALLTLVNNIVEKNPAKRARNGRKLSNVRNAMYLMRK